MYVFMYVCRRIECIYVKESLKVFLEKINSIHPAIKLTTAWSHSLVNFPDVKVILKNRMIITDLLMKSTDIHQYLDSS